MPTLRWLSVGPLAAATALGLRVALAGWRERPQAVGRALRQIGASPNPPGLPPMHSPLHHFHLPPILSAPIQPSTLVTSMAFTLPLVAIGDLAVRVASTLIVTLAVNLLLALINRARVRFSVPPAAGATLAPGERASLTPHQGVQASAPPAATLPAATLPAAPQAPGEGR